MRIKSPDGHKKEAIIRRRKGRPVSAILLMQDETIIRLFPNMRRSWSQQGSHAKVGVCGRTVQQALSLALNLSTGAVTAHVQRRKNLQGFLTTLRAVHSRSGTPPIDMLQDGFRVYWAKKSLQRAFQQNFTPIELPRQCLNLTASISAGTLDEQTSSPTDNIQILTVMQKRH